MTETLAARFTAGTNLLGATPLAPWLQLLSAPTNGAVQLQLTGGEAYRSYQMQASGDLMAWDALTTITATNSSFIFTDPAPAATNRHYRALAIP